MDQGVRLFGALLTTPVERQRGRSSLRVPLAEAAFLRGLGLDSMKLPHPESPRPPARQGPNWGTWLLAGIVAIIALSAFLLVYRYAAGFAYR